MVEEYECGAGGKQGALGYLLVIVVQTPTSHQPAQPSFAKNKINQLHDNSFRSISWLWHSSKNSVHRSVPAGVAPVHPLQATLSIFGGNGNEIGQSISTRLDNCALCSDWFNTYLANCEQAQGKISSGHQSDTHHLTRKLLYPRQTYLCPAVPWPSLQRLRIISSFII